MTEKLFFVEIGFFLEIIALWAVSQDFMTFKGYIVFFYDFPIICQISGIRMFVSDELMK